MDASQARRELLRAYFISLAAEGHFAGLSPAGVAAKVGELLARDIPAAMADVMADVARQGVARAGAVVIGKLGEIASKMRDGRFVEILGDVQAAYQRGLDSMQRKK